MSALLTTDQVADAILDAADRGFEKYKIYCECSGVTPVSKAEWLQIFFNCMTASSERPMS